MLPRHPLAPVLLGLTTVLLGNDCAAQTAPCLAANAATTSVGTATSAFSFSGQNYFAWRFTPPSATTIHAARVYTENVGYPGDVFCAVEIWDEQNGAPGARLGGGAWKIDNNRPLGWHGANFDTPVALQPATPTWFVFVDPAYSVVPIDPNGSLVLQHVSRSGPGAWLSQGTNAPKFQLFCSLLDDVNVAPNGQGCPLSTGETPTLYVNEAPTLGNSAFRWESCGLPTGGAVFAVIGNDPSFAPIAVPGLPAGCLQNTNALASVLLFAGTGDTRGPSFSGYTSIGFAIPNNPSLGGARLSMQMVPIDTGATSQLPFSTSNALGITLY